MTAIIIENNNNKERKIRMNLSKNTEDEVKE